ncbi:NAD(P)H-dependent flavin oxidoreductase [Sneathiella glossodoripedis]|uniref:NAD(P)H-dependent flavin oxidoreductase n=1 Tax=Sneathiella glossodoripedis TaxID=418853 RepID=UPI00047128F3|nr:nitronate monooxygenase [Sneathiella glossodoripedis]
MAELDTLYGTKNPIFQAGMGGIAGPELTAAISNVGGLGHLGAIRLSAKDLKNWIAQTKALTDKPFAVNLVPPGGGPDGFDAQLDVTISEKPKAVSLYWGDFGSVIPKLKEAGISVMVQVGSLAEAQKALSDGADTIIAQGIEAGGHVKSKIGLMSILPDVLKIAGTTPVLAAGGLSNPSKIKAVLGMGAAGVWVGTSFIVATESNAHEIYRERLIEATVDDTHHGHFYSYGWPIGTPYRVIKPGKNYSLRNFKAAGARRSDSEAFARTVQLYAGQGVGDVKEKKSAAEILNDLSADLY